MSSTGYYTFIETTCVSISMATSTVDNLASAFHLEMLTSPFTSERTKLIYLIFSLVMKMWYDMAQTISLKTKGIFHTK